MIAGLSLINDPLDEFPNPKPLFVVARTAPAAIHSPRHGNVLYFGDQAGNPTFTYGHDGDGDIEFVENGNPYEPTPEIPKTPFNGANIYMVDADNGDLIAMTKVAQDHVMPRPASTAQDFTILTTAMAVQDGVLITGVSGLGEANPQCFPGAMAPCTFKGRILAFDAETLERLWEAYTVPLDPGYAGASVWGSTPAIDPGRNQVYVTTGDNYKIPDDIEACVDAAKNPATFRPEDELNQAVKKCFKGVSDWKDNHFDSVLALDLMTGAINRSFSTLPYDAWTLGCLGPDWAADCGPDMDFSQAPMICSMTNVKKGKSEDVLVVGQKTGDMYGLDPATGKFRWRKQNNQGGSPFPRGLVGGFQWGSACTANTVVGLNANSYAADHHLKGGETTTGGTIVGFDPSNGRIVFETAQTDDTALTGALLDVVVGILFDEALDPTANTSTIGAPSCAGSTCFWGSTGVDGWLFATDTATGETVWSQKANGSVLWGGAIVDLGDGNGGKMWFVGSGYSSFTTGAAAIPGEPNFWGFSIPDAAP